MSKKFLIDIDMGGTSRIHNLPTPTTSGEPATMGYVDSALEGLAWKDNVRVASTANINLSSPGSTIDGVTLTSGDRFLAKNQTLPAENGIYVFNGSAVSATRSLDANTASELEQAVTSVSEGTSGGSSFRQTNVNFTLGSGAISWSTFGASAPPASETTPGIAEIATQTETDTGTDDQRFVTPLKLANWSGRIRKMTATIGDGAATQYDVSHNFNTQLVNVQVFRSSSPWDNVEVDIERPTTNTVRIRFGTAPASGAYTVVVIA
jgi:hypothetical protein